MLEPHRDLIESQVFTASFIGTVRGGVPLAHRGAGVRMESATVVRMSVGARWLPKLEPHLEVGGPISLSFADVSNYRSLQIKGVLLEVTAPDDADHERAALAYQRFREGVEGWMPSIVKFENAAARVLRVEARAIFDQTPGPGAGRAL